MRINLGSSRIVFDFAFYVFFKFLTFICFSCQVHTTVTIDELATPGLKSIISFVVPDQRSGKVE